MSGALVCWRCGASLEELLLPSNGSSNVRNAKPLSMSVACAGSIALARAAPVMSRWPNTSTSIDRALVQDTRALLNDVTARLFLA